MLDTTWTPDSTRLCLGSSEGVLPLAVSDGSGGAIIAWLEARRLDSDVFAQHLLSDGSVAPSWPQGGLSVCGAANAQYDLAIASDNSGGALLAWVDFRQGAVGNVYVQRITGAGGAPTGWPAGGLAIAAYSKTQTGPAIAPDGNGGAIVAWLDRRAGASRARVTHVTSAGQIDSSWPSGGLVLGADGQEQADLRLCSQTSGGVIAAWATRGSSDVRATELSNSGAIGSGWSTQGVALSDAGVEKRLRALVSDGSRGAIAVWEETGTNGGRLRAQRVLASGTVAGDWPTGGVAPAGTGSTQFAASARPDGRGGVAIAWQDFRSGSRFGAYAQVVDSTGHIASGWPEAGLAIPSNGDDELMPAIAPDSVGLVVTWSDPQSASAAGVFPTQLMAMGLAQPKLVSVEAFPGRAKIVWAVASGPASQITFHAARRGSDQNSTQVASVKPDKTGQIVVSDRKAPSGTRQWYRLSISTESGEIYLPEVEVVIPAPKPLALSGAHFASAGRGIVVSFTLPNDSPAEVSVFDVAGRKIAHRDLTEFGSGDHQAQLQVSGDAGPSVYFLRLTQGSASRTRHISLYR